MTQTSRTFSGHSALAQPIGARQWIGSVRGSANQRRPFHVRCVGSFLFSHCQFYCDRLAKTKLEYARIYYCVLFEQLYSSEQKWILGPKYLKYSQLQWCTELLSGRESSRGYFQPESLQRNTKKTRIFLRFFLGISTSIFPNNFDSQDRISHV